MNGVIKNNFTSVFMTIGIIVTTIIVLPTFYYYFMYKDEKENHDIYTLNLFEEAKLNNNNELGEPLRELKQQQFNEVTHSEY